MIDKEANAAAFEPYREWLVNRRKELGLTPLQVSRAMGLRRPYMLTAMELGLRVPTLATLERWLEALRANLTIKTWEKQ